MGSKIGILFAVAVLAVAFLVPAFGTDADGGLFSYKSQLDENGLHVYKEVAGSDNVVDDTKTFVIEFEDIIYWPGEERAKQYAEETVQNALAAAYLSNPMVPYLWNYPVTKVLVEATLDIEGNEETGNDNHYGVTKVTFSLTVPEGITADSMKELDEAIKGYKISGSSDADKVSDIMSQLDKLKFKQDDEGKVSNIYDALVKKEATSAGIAQAFMQFCNLNNIPSIIVAGDNLKADKETKSFWNYVYLEGDHKGETYFSWYIVDPTYFVSAGICGYLTSVEYDGDTYSMSALLYTDLELSSKNVLEPPKLSAEKYVRPGGPSFLEQHGEKLVLAGIGVVLAAGMLYAVRKGIY